jgi:hypothetical protein
MCRQTFKYLVVKRIEEINLTGSGGISLEYFTIWICENHIKLLRFVLILNNDVINRFVDIKNQHNSCSVFTTNTKNCIS